MVVRPRELEQLYSGLKAQFGDNSVSWASEIPDYEVVSTGSLAVDYAIGIGGLPSNRVVEISGEEGTGKTTLALHTINNFLKRYPERGAVFLDCEHRLTVNWAARFVDDMDRFLVLWPDTIEQATNMYRDTVGGNEEKKIPGGLTSIAVLDSIAGAPTQRVTEKSSEKGNMGGNSLGVSAFANFATTFSGKYSCCTIGINQVRDDMDGWNRVITPGGHGWKHACSVRINLKKGDQKFIDKINGENVQVGYSVVAKIIKNSVAPPFRLGWYCVTGDTTVTTGAGTSITLKELYEIWHSKKAIGREQRGYWYRRDGYQILAHVNGRIKPQRMVNIFHNGVRSVWEVHVEGGASLKATANHQHLTEDGWKRVDELTLSDCLATMGEREDYITPRRSEDASPNGKNWVKADQELPRECSVCGETEGRLEIAHLDNDPTNWSSGNIVRLCNHHHKIQDYSTGSRKKRWSKGRPVVYRQITSIEYVGEEEVYDVSMGPETDHSWLANGSIVTHNCFYNVESKYGFGVDTNEEAIRLGVLTGVVEQRGAWYYHEALPGGKANGQGKLIDALMGDSTARDKIVQQTLDKLQTGQVRLDVSYDPDAPDAVAEPRLGLKLGDES